MELKNTIMERRSVRRFTDKPLPADVVRDIIDSANWAPTACNIQGIKFILFTDKKQVERLVSKGLISYAKDAQLGILVLYDTAQSDNLEYMDHVQSAAAAIQNMLLTAYSHNVGSVWICHLPSKAQLRRMLDIPRRFDVIAYVALGYYDSYPKQLPRKFSFEHLVSYNIFNFSSKDMIKYKRSIHLRRLAIRLYKKMPFKKYILPITKKFEKFN